MGRHHGQRGEGKVGCILWTLVLVVAGMIAWEAIPVKIASSELYDFMVEQAKWAGHTPPDTLKRYILDRANELKVPLDPKNLSVERVRDRIRMRAYYVVPLEFPGYVYDWEFDLQVDRPVFVI
jgi:hypothetical protein